MNSAVPTMGPNNVPAPPTMAQTTASPDTLIEHVGSRGVAAEKGKQCAGDAGKKSGHHEGDQAAVT